MKDMRDRKVVQILVKFSQEDLNDFSNWLSTPYFNTNSVLIPIYNTIKETLLDKGDKTISAEEFFAHALPDSTFKPNRLNKLMAELFNAAKNFLAWQEFKSDNRAQAVFTLRAMNRRRMDKHLTRAYEEFEKQVKQFHPEDAEFFHFRYELESQHVQLQIRLSNQKKGHPLFQEMINNLDRYYLTKKIELASGAINNELTANSQHELLFMDEIMQVVESDHFSLPPIGQLYLTAYRTMVDPDNTEHYFRLVELLEQHHKDFSNLEVYTMFVACLNYCSRRCNSGHTEFLQEAGKLYEKFFDQLFLDENGHISWINMNIAVTYMSRLKNYEWLESFISEYSDKVYPDPYHNALPYSKGVMYYHRRDFRQAKESFETVLNGADDFGFDSGARSYLWRINYELGDYDAASYQADAFRMYLSRNKKVVGPHRLTYSNFIKFFNRLIKYQLGNPDLRKKKLTKLAEDIQNTKYIATRGWLQEQVKKALQDLT